MNRIAGKGGKSKAPPGQQKMPELGDYVKVRWKH